MSSNLGIRYGLHTVAIACIAAAYLLASLWVILPALALLGVGWFLLRRNLVAGSSRWLLAGTTGLAAIGAMMDLAMILIVVGMVAALAAWDLEDFDATLQDSARAVDRSRLMHLHMKWLLVALGSGMPLALLASIGKLDLPFAVAAALAVVLVVSLTRAAQQLMGAKRG
jgi:hypothetical protein